VNVLELFFFVLAPVALSIWLGKFLFGYIGWWSILLAPSVGFGSVYLLLFALFKSLPDKKRQKR
jgi:uncharacterized BrkB/YihY/UPF0761 family membrane protein